VEGLFVRRGRDLGASVVQDMQSGPRPEGSDGVRHAIQQPAGHLEPHDASVEQPMASCPECASDVPAAASSLLGVASFQVADIVRGARRFKRGIAVPDGWHPGCFGRLSQEADIQRLVDLLHLCEKAGRLPPSAKDAMIKMIPRHKKTPANCFV
jgi:hypothetical protein